MKVCIIGGGGQVAEGIGALLTQRGITPVFYRPDWIAIPGVPQRPKRVSDRLDRIVLKQTPNALIESCQLQYKWVVERDLSSTDVFIFTLPSFLAERIGIDLAPFLAGKVLINISDRFLGTYALAVAALQQGKLPVRLGIAFNSPPLLAYQPQRDLATHLYYQKPFVVMGCFPRQNVTEAQEIISDLFGIPTNQIRAVPSMLDLAFENVNSILHAVQDLENLRHGKYLHLGSLYDPEVYTDAMVKRIYAIVQERDSVARRFVDTSFRSLETFDGSTFHNSTALSVSPAGTALYRHHHPLLKTIPRPTWYSAHGYEDVGWSMVPIENFGSLLGVNTPNLTILINEWNQFMGINYRFVGRSARSLRLVDAGNYQTNPRNWSWRFDVY